MRYNIIVLVVCMILLVGAVAIFMPIEQQLTVAGIVVFGLIFFIIEVVLPILWKKKTDE